MVSFHPHPKYTHKCYAHMDIDTCAGEDICTTRHVRRCEHGYIHMGVSNKQLGNHHVGKQKLQGPLCLQPLWVSGPVWVELGSLWVSLWVVLGRRFQKMRFLNSWFFSKLDFLKTGFFKNWIYQKLDSQILDFSIIGFSKIGLSKIGFLKYGFKRI